MVRRKYIDNKGITDPIQARIEAELVRRDREDLPKSFKSFLKAAWHQVEDLEFRSGWHIDAICEHLQACADRRIKDLVINLSPRLGKLLADDTPMLTTEGWKTHGELKRGDFVFHPSGKPIKVVAVSEPHFADCEVELMDGEKIQCHENHEWAIVDRPMNTSMVVETKYLFKRKLLTPHKTKPPRPVIALPNREALQFEEKELPIDPYFLGVWLGDGRTKSVDFCFAEKDRCVFDEVVRRGLVCSWSTVHKTTGVNYVGFKGWTKQFRSLGLLTGPKRIPEIYLRASITQRLELLAGLIDTDGTVDKKSGVNFSTCELGLRDTFIELIRGLGMHVSVSVTPACLSSSGIQGRKDTYTIGFQPAMEIPTIIPRKKITRGLAKTEKRRRSIKAVRRVHPKVGRCIQVDSPDGLYLAGQTLVPTHNSVISSVLFPAWVLARNPSEILLFASYSSILANRDSVKCRRLVESDWYRARFPHVAIEDDSNLKSAWLTTAKGGRQATSVGGTVTGMGGTFLIVDDPLNASDAESVVEREKANTWFAETWSNRIHGDPKNAVSIVIMQRLHANDVSNLCIEEMGYEKLVLPMEYEGNKYVTSIGWSDPRTENGELMWPDMWDRKAIDKQKKKSGSYAWAGQYQQRPAPRGGGMVKRKWFNYWYDPSVKHNPKAVVSIDENGEASEKEPILFDLHPLTPHKTFMTVDAAFKGEASSDYTVIQVWTKIGADYYLLDQVRERMDFVATCSVIRHLHSKWNPLPTLIEDKANGAAIISSLKGEVGGVIPVNPEGGKVARMSAISPLIEAGNVYVPHPDMYSWVEPFLEEVTLFPQAPNDDQCDAMSQLLNYMREKKVDIVDVSFLYSGGSSGAGSDDSSLIQDCYWDGAN